MHEHRVKRNETKTDSPLAKVDHGDESTQAIYSGCAAAMIMVWPGVSISYALNA